MNCLKKICPLGNLNDTQKHKLKEQAKLIFAAAIWIGILILMFVCSPKNGPKGEPMPGPMPGIDLPLQPDPRVPTGAAKFY